MMNGIWWRYMWYNYVCGRIISIFFLPIDLSMYLSLKILFFIFPISPFIPWLTGQVIHFCSWVYVGPYFSSLFLPHSTVGHLLRELLSLSVTQNAKTFHSFFLHLYTKSLYLGTMVCFSPPLSAVHQETMQSKFRCDWRRIRRLERWSTCFKISCRFIYLFIFVSSFASPEMYYLALYGVILYPGYLVTWWV